MAESEASAEADADGEEWEFSDRAKVGALIAIVGIVGTGVVDFVLSQAGAPGVGSAVWAAGYALTVLSLWYVLLRPIDLG